MSRPGAIAAYLLVMSASVSSAHADVVPPPPKNCPDGEVGVTSHSGPKCTPEAPDDCAPGYRGRVGGECVLANCSTDGQCEPGERCMQVDTCQEYRELHWNGWGWSAQRPVRNGNFFGGPPRPRPEGPPKKAWVELNICGQDGACASPAECRPSSLCYPTSAIGKTKAKVVEHVEDSDQTSPSDTSSTPGIGATGDGAPGPAGPSIPVEPSDTVGSDARPGDTDAPAADGGGCRKGCSAAPTNTPLGWRGVPLWVLAALLLRRRRERGDAGRAGER